MDKIRQQPKFKKYLRSYWLLMCLFAIATYFVLFQDHAVGKVQHISKESIVASTVIGGHFDDKLKLRASVSPQTSVYLDAISGGRVEERLVEQGEYVEKGQPLVRLSNVSLQLDVMSREAQVTEQLNFLRNTQMTMTTNRLNLRRDILEIELKIAHLNRQIEQSNSLVKKGVLAKDELQSQKLDLTYYQERKALTKQRQKEEEEIRKLQVLQLEESAQMLQKNLQFARNNLENLLVKAPVSGYLSELNVELGESKSQGARLGQIDIPNKFKLVASIDEFYLNQVSIGMPATVSINGTALDIIVNKIDSRVNQAQFQIEFNIPSNINNITRGQNLDVVLTLSSGIENSILVKHGPFFNATGGNWIFVLNEDGNSAERRNIRLGKRNQNYYRVISGLKVGEQVITSNYNAFDKADIIKITGSES